MISNIVGQYQQPVILQCDYPEKIDVSEKDYEAKTFAGGNAKATQRPFIVAHPVEVTLKVLPWTGTTPILWTFTPGPYPMPLKRVYADINNSATDIQISY